MAHPGQRHTPARYKFRIGERLDAHWSSWFDDLDLTHEDDGTTALTGPIQDQAQLHGLLARIRDLGLTLLGVLVLEPHVATVDKTYRSDGTGDAANE
jgi:hypothetical protein